MQEYILLLAQAPNGGLRDKPGKGPDAYHTCYNLSGLSSAQHFLLPVSPATVSSLADEFVDPFVKPQLAEVVDGGNAPAEFKMILGEGESVEMATRRMKEIYVRAIGWEKRGESLLIGGADNELVSIVPFVLPLDFFSIVLVRLFSGMLSQGCACADVLIPLALADANSSDFQHHDAERSPNARLFLSSTRSYSHHRVESPPVCSTVQEEVVESLELSYAAASPRRDT